MMGNHMPLKSCLLCRKLIDVRVVLCAIAFAAFTAALMFNVFGLQVLAGEKPVMPFSSRSPSLLSLHEL